MKFLALTLGLLSLSVATAQAQSSTKAAFSLPALPYATDALTPFIDAQTMEIHHGKHHMAYVNNLNVEVLKDSRLAGKSLEEIMASISTYNTAVRNNAGGHWNHTFFWNIMAPPASAGKLSGSLEQALTKSFGSVDKFKEAFEKAGTSQFGSGWVWLVVTPDKKLAITSTANQDNPLMDNAAVKGTPILGNDVWEHAYYLAYQNKRGDYLKSWWSVVNWPHVTALYEEAIK